MDVAFSFCTACPDFSLLWQGSFASSQVPTGVDKNLQPHPELEDGEAVAQAHVNAVAGACLAIGVRYAGTGSTQAKATLFEHVTAYLGHKMQAPDPFAGDDLGCSEPPCLILITASTSSLLCSKTAGAVIAERLEQSWSTRFGLAPCGRTA